MKPQTIKYGNGNEVTLLDGTHTYLVHVDQLILGALFTPIILVEGITPEYKIKFEFFKAYSNAEGEVLHCEYRSAGTELLYKLIVHTQ